jgi:hypothetical protein
MAPSPEEQKLEAGVVVKLKGLVGAAQHNGQHGELVRFDEEKGRWAVSPHFSTFVSTRQHAAFRSSPVPFTEAHWMWCDVDVEMFAFRGA